MTSPLPAHARLEYKLVPLSAIGDLDAAVLRMHLQTGRIGGHMVPGEQWTQDALISFCVAHPPILVKAPGRTGCYQVVANYEALSLIRLHTEASVRVPCLVANSRVGAKEKQQWAAIGYLGHSALFRDRQGQALTMASLWLFMREQSINPLNGESLDVSTAPFR